jgi:hypothetical protein
MISKPMLIGLLVALVCFLWLVGYKSRRDQQQDRNYKYKTRRIMSDNEIEFFRRLTRAVPKCYVFPQMALSAIVMPAVYERKERMAAFGQVAYKRVDYAIFTAGMTLVCVVELDDQAYSPVQDKERDMVMESAGIKRLRFSNKTVPSQEEIATAFKNLTAPPGVSPTSAKTPATPSVTTSPTPVPDPTPTPTSDPAPVVTSVTNAPAPKPAPTPTSNTVAAPVATPAKTVPVPNPASTATSVAAAPISKPVPASADSTAPSVQTPA